MALDMVCMIPLAELLVQVFNLLLQAGFGRLWTGCRDKRRQHQTAGQQVAFMQ